MSEPCIIAVDQSTSASKAFLLDSQGNILRRASRAHKQYYPAPGHVEHDAAEIYANVQAVISEVSQGVQAAGMALCNQRETVVLWDRKTGEPLCPAIVWQDIRATDWCEARKAESDWIRERTGLSLAPFYSAAKAAQALRENPHWKDVCIGTVDSFLVYRLTGGRVFRTDVSNAGRTQLMNLRALAWDAELCAFFGIPMRCLPEIVPSDAGFGKTQGGVPILAAMGDSHASLFGQGCYQSGMAKATYGTGSSVLLNTGDTPVSPPQGLCATVGFHTGGSIRYALEGNVHFCGDTLQWLINQLDLFQSADELAALALTVPDSGGVSLVPAFSGLGAPYEREDARAVICGMSRGTTRAHIARAALESIALQDADVISAMGVTLTELRADGGPAKNAMLMQLQADLLGCPVQCTAQAELSAVGVGRAAITALGLPIPPEEKPAARYVPRMAAADREAKLASWRAAVQKAMQ